jgi:arylsulfatase A-like enzyme
MAVVSLSMLLGIVYIISTLLVAASSGSSDAQPQKKQPNVVILFADNLAYDDVGTFQATTRDNGRTRSRTPRTDVLATEGLKLLHWNSPAVLCSASRAALLTGKYPVRTGVYPRVFEPDAQHGLLPNETTIADYLKEEGYATKLVGKWHLGSRPGYLPTDRGFDSWFGIPYHMSGGSLDGHLCGKLRDPNGTQWLPLFDGHEIIEQPVDLRNLAPRYVNEARDFIHQYSSTSQPFFLYMAFSHVHQLCAPRLAECQWASSHFSKQNSTSGFTASYGDAVEEMDWILGGIMDALEDAGVADDTLVIFTSDNGPWTAEQSCAGSKGPFKGTWLKQNVDDSCTACPSEYKPAPLGGNKRRCIYPGTNYEVIGVPCGEDSGLGSAWEANVRMPGLVRWKNGGVPVNKTSLDMVSTLDVLPTILSIIGKDVPEVDGIDVKDIFLGEKVKLEEEEKEGRPIFFWRDGFKHGPLPPPFGRFDVVAMKLGWFKIWFWTKSSHYNADAEVYHNPPLIFDVLNDPAEAYPLDPSKHSDMISRALNLVSEHKASVHWTRPLTLARDPKYLPCADLESGCRTSSPPHPSSLDKASVME